MAHWAREEESQHGGPLPAPSATSVHLPCDHSGKHLLAPSLPKRQQGSPQGSPGEGWWACFIAYQNLTNESGPLDPLPSLSRAQTCTIMLTWSEEQSIHKVHKILKDKEKGKFSNF